MRWMKFLSILFALAVPAVLGAGCGQLDENGRPVVYDVRSVGAETVVVVVHSDLRVPEEVAVDLARTIRIVDRGAPIQSVDLRRDNELGGMVWIEMNPALEGKVPVVAPESRADYEALRDLVHEYARLEIVAPDLAPDGAMDTPR